MSVSEPADVRRFISALSTTLRGYFGQGFPIHVSRAPGRLDVMGGIADYSGSLVLEGTLAEATVCGVQLRNDRVVRIQSANAAAEGLEPEVSASLDDLLPGSGGDPYEVVRDRLAQDRRRGWVAYVAGVFSVLRAEGVLPRFERGATIAMQSDVPLGAGVSSSAALEVAAAMGLLAAYGLNVPGMRLAALCQIVENRVVGAPCGIMDQVTSLLGEAGGLLALRCQPHELEGTVALPSGIRVVGLDTHVKHAVGGSRYTDTRVGAFMGQRIISREMSERGESDTTRGYLCNLTPEEYVARWKDSLPSRMTGAAFLARYGKTNDPVTRVIPETTYMIRSRTEHPIYENARVESFREHLRRAGERGVHRVHGVHEEMIHAGELMYASNWSYGSRCGMGSRETELVVRMVRRLGPEAGFYGAKITGGGSGGTVAILCKHDTDSALSRLAAEYEERTGRKPRLFLGTGPGALQFGTRVIAP